MINKDSIKKLNNALKKGDQAEIAKLSGLSKITVNRFFNGNEDWLSEEAVSKVIENTAIVIKARKKLREKNEKMTETIANSI